MKSAKKLNDPASAQRRTRSDIWNAIYVVIFFAVCAAPLLLWGFLKNDEPIGNNELSELPSLKNADGNLNAEYFSQFDDYFTDHLPLRAQLVTADNFIKSQLLGGNTANVISGKNGYIFSAETVDDYVGVTYSQRKINNIARTAKLMQEKAESSGNNFVFTVIPNKSSVYPEYMPPRYIKSDVNNLSLLESELAALGVNYADVRSALLIADGELYFKRDTHWNGLGALYGFNAIMNSLGKDASSYNGIDYKYIKDWRGDIDKLLYPSGGVYDWQYYFDIDVSALTFMSPYLGADNEAVLRELMSDSEEHDTMIKTVNPRGQGQLLMLRDSFSRAMLPFLLTSYRSTTITRSQPFAMTSLADGSGTDVIYEIVERNLGKIVESAPIMEAVRCDAPMAGEAVVGDNTIRVDKTQSFTRIYGILDKKYFDDSSRIFVTCSDGATSYTYEAFPICETELLSLDEPSDYGFSLILADDITGGSYDISITVVSENASFSTGVLTNAVIND